MTLIEVQRVSGGYTEHLHPFEVVIDDRVVALLGPGESCAHEATAGPHQVFVRVDWCRSEIVEVDLEGDEKVAFRCDTRAKLLTDGYWATLGRNRYLRLTGASADGKAGRPATRAPAHPGDGTSAARPFRLSAAVPLLAAALLLALALGRGLGFLAGISVIFIAVEVVIAINFHLLGSRSFSGPGTKSHQPFRFRTTERAILSGLLAAAGIATLIGLLHEDNLAGWLAVGAAALGALNVVGTRRS